MANHKSAAKRYRQSIKRRDHNRDIKGAVRESIKDTRLAVAEGNKAKAKELLAKTEKMIAKATAKGIYHKSNAARKVGRLTVFVTKMA